MVSFSWFFIGSYYIILWYNGMRSNVHCGGRFFGGRTTSIRVLTHDLIFLCVRRIVRTSYAQKAHDVSDRWGLNCTHVLNRMIRHPMNRRWQKQGAMCIWLWCIMWSARKISRCDLWPAGRRIASLSYSNKYNVHTMHHYQRRYRPSLCRGGLKDFASFTLKFLCRESTSLTPRVVSNSNHYKRESSTRVL